MPRKRRTSEIVRMLKNRLRQSDRDTVLNVVGDLRQFAVANEFYCYRAVDNIVSMCHLSRALTRDDVERAIRKQSTW